MRSDWVSPQGGDPVNASSSGRGTRSSARSPGAIRVSGSGGAAADLGGGGVSLVGSTAGAAADLATLGGAALEALARGGEETCCDEPAANGSLLERA